jgi:hypothetical protein
MSERFSGKIEDLRRDHKQDSSMLEINKASKTVGDSQRASLERKAEARVEDKEGLDISQEQRDMGEKIERVNAEQRAESAVRDQDSLDKAQKNYDKSLGKSKKHYYRNQGKYVENALEDAEDAGIKVELKLD